ncbi:ABC transporter permease [Paenibacillus taiwanensis]|uniref:ABC transporter permease n=1 Tax=Paenibacillus taiwanensis TaxID=401638 RepID=UPI0003FFF06E|nr:ABC transporter permease [Paenibacillus taiwanensis]
MMTFSMSRLQAIIGKEYKDAMKNTTLLLTAVLPILFSYMFGTIAEGATSLVLTLPINMALMMTGASVQAIMIAEEKEKHTLRVLMLSPARPMEVLMGKSVIAGMLTILVLIASFVVGKTPHVPIAGLLLTIAPTLIMYLAMGTIIGLLSRSTMETTFVSMPIMVLFMFGPLFGPSLKSELVNTLVSYTPSERLTIAIDLLWKGGSIGDILVHAAIICIWMIASIVACLVLYRSKRYDA